MAPMIVNTFHRLPEMASWRGSSPSLRSNRRVSEAVTTAFIQENQAIRRYLCHASYKLLAPFPVGFSISFSGVERLFFKRSFCFFNQCRIWERLSEMPASFCNSCCTSAKVRTCCAANQTFIYRCISMPAAGLRPGWWGTRAAWAVRLRCAENFLPQAKLTKKLSAKDSCVPSP
jgi:hypothetical protein